MRITSLTLDTVVTTDTGASEFTFRATRPIHFRAGQGGLIVVPGGGAKPFTFSSGDRSDTIAIATTLQSGSRFKRALADLAIGSRVVVAGAMGTLPAIGPAESQVLVAQGIGITPFLSMARSSGVVNASLLQVGAPHFFDEVAASVASAQRIDHRDQLSAAVVEAVADRPDAHWSLSGTAGFVDSVAARLSRAGVSSRRVHKDAFWGMRAPAASAASHELVAA